jgi:hypothetical protein
MISYYNGYNPILTEMAQTYLLEKNSFDFLKVIPMVETFMDYGSIPKANIAEERRKIAGTYVNGEPIVKRKIDGGLLDYRLTSFADSISITASELASVSVLHGGKNGLSSAISQAQVRIEAQKIRNASARVVHSIIAGENGFAQTFFNASNFGSNVATPNWSNTSTATPINDIEDYKVAVELSGGPTPNVAIMTKSVFTNLKKNVQVLSKMGGGYLGDVKGVITPFDEMRVAAALGVDKVHVVKTTWNTAGLGATASNAYVAGGNFLLLGYFENSTSLVSTEVGATLGVGFIKNTAGILTGNRVDSGYSNELNEAIPFPIEVRKQYDASIAGGGEDSWILEAIMGYKIANPELGFLATVTV